MTPPVLLAASRVDWTVDSPKVSRRVREGHPFPAFNRVLGAAVEELAAKTAMQDVA